MTHYIGFYDPSSSWIIEVNCFRRSCRFVWSQWQKRENNILESPSCKNSPSFLKGCPPMRRNISAQQPYLFGWQSGKGCGDIRECLLAFKNVQWSNSRQIKNNKYVWRWQTGVTGFNQMNLQAAKVAAKTNKHNRETVRNVSFCCAVYETSWRNTKFPELRNLWIQLWQCASFGISHYRVRGW